VPASAIGMADGLLEVDGQAGEPRADAAGPDTPALLLHTSGTTSKPKTVPIRERKPRRVGRRWSPGRTQLTGDDVTMCVIAPLFHVHGLVATVLATAVDRRDSGAAPGSGRRRSGTRRPGTARRGTRRVPTIHARLLTQARALASPPEHRFRFVRSCSAPLPHGLVARTTRRRSACPLVEAYGMTEAAHQMASNPLPPGERRPGDGRAGDRHRDRRPG